VTPQAGRSAAFSVFCRRIRSDFPDNSLGDRETDFVDDRFVLLSRRSRETLAKITICAKLQQQRRMRRLSEHNGIWLGGFAALAICCSVLLGACAISPPASTTVTHVVLMWLKHPERSSDRAQLIRAAHSLRMIPGVLRVEAGRTAPPLPSRPPQDFDLAVVITFRDRAALERYEEDPRHLAAVHRYLRPLVRHYEVYNLTSR
jgi:hypothetical protein